MVNISQSRTLTVQYSCMLSNGTTITAPVPAMVTKQNQKF